jgi:hypothetical protein
MQQGNNLITYPTSPNHWQHLRKFGKGSLIKAHASELLHKHLERSKTIENAAAARKLKSWRCHQHGSIMYAGDGQELVKIKAEVELEKSRALVRQE